MRSLLLKTFKTDQVKGLKSLKNRLSQKSKVFIKCTILSKILKFFSKASGYMVFGAWKNTYQETALHKVGRICIKFEHTVKAKS